MRKIYLDVMNIIACIAVIALHCNGIVHQYSEISAWRTSLIVEVACYWSVPVFLLITGANLLDYHKKYELKIFLSKRIKRIITPYILTSIVIIIYKMATGTTFMSSFSLKEMLELFWYHSYEPIYYYIFIILGIYFTIPLLTHLTKEGNEGLLNYGIIMLFINNVFMPSVSQSYGIPFNSSISLNIGNYIIYILLGYKLANIKLKISSRTLLYITAVILNIYKYIHTLQQSAIKEQYDQTFTGYTHVITVISAVAIFELIKNFDYSNIENNTKLVTVINKLSSYSYLVYLLHMLVIDLQMRLFDINRYSASWRTAGVLSTYIITIVIIIVGKNLCSVVERIYKYLRESKAKRKC